MPEGVQVETSELPRLLDRADVGLAVLDAQGRVLVVNRALTHHLGVDEGDLTGRGLGILLGRDADRFDEADPLRGADRWDTRRFVETGDDSVILLDVTLVPLAVRTTVTGYLLVARRVSVAPSGADASPDGHFRSLVDTSPLPIMVVCDGVVVFANRACGKMFGADPGALAGSPAARWLGPDHAAALERSVGRPVEFELRGERSDGERILEIAGSPCHFTGVDGHQLVIDDATERRRQEAQLVHDASHDPLTGLPNRSLLLDRIDGAMARRRRQGGVCGVLVVDLDRFKEVNDSFGHAAGDDILLAVTARLLDVVRPTDTVSRLGGDEFVVVCEVAMADEARVIAERIVRVLEQPVPVHGGHLASIGASVGLALASGDVDAASVLEHADQVMFEAKRMGRGGWRQAPTPG